MAILSVAVWKFHQDSQISNDWITTKDFKANELNLLIKLLLIISSYASNAIVENRFIRGTQIAVWIFRCAGTLIHYSQSVVLN